MRQEKTKTPRVRLSREMRERLIRGYIERQVKKGTLPSRRQIAQAVGGNTYTILALLKEYQKNHSAAKPQPKKEF